MSTIECLPMSPVSKSRKKALSKWYGKRCASCGDVVESDNWVICSNCDLPVHYQSNGVPGPCADWKVTVFTDGVRKDIYCKDCTCQGL